MRANFIRNKEGSQRRTLRYVEGEPTQYLYEISRIPPGFYYFPAPLRYNSVAVHQVQLPHRALRIRENSPKTRCEACC